MRTGLAPRWADGWASRLLPVAIACAVVLLFATVARQGDGAVNDNPQGYRFLTLCGLVTAVALAVGAWERSRRAVAALAALAAAAVFTYAAFLTVRYWLSATRGGLRDQWAEWGVSVHTSPLLPLFALAAALGALSALVLAVHWTRPATTARTAGLP